jgi:hypothetical protein
MAICEYPIVGLQAVHGSAKVDRLVFAIRSADACYFLIITKIDLI